MQENRLPNSIRPWVKRGLILLVLFIIAASAGIWYIFTEKFSDTAKQNSAFTIRADSLIHAFQKNESIANLKYAEKIITVTGIVSETETADSSVNIKFTDSETGSYIIFEFQEINMADAKKLKEGDTVSIKGSCSGGAYSTILETEFITFKRCTLHKNS